MINEKVVVVLLIITNYVCGCDLQNGWKGIRVLKSSREEAERAFGRPIKEEKGEVQYETTRFGPKTY